MGLEHFHSSFLFAVLPLSRDPHSEPTHMKIWLLFLLQVPSLMQEQTPELPQLTRRAAI